MLVTCDACGGQVSGEADRCPHCGHPINRGLLGKAGPERVVNVGCLTILLVGFMVISGFVVLAICSGII